jgi:hypothetical protein
MCVCYPFRVARSGPPGDGSSKRALDGNGGPALPNQITPLAHGSLNGQTLKIELVEPGNDLPTAVVVKWPVKPTITSPATFDKVVADAMKVLSNAVVELAAVRVWKRL